MSSIIDVREVFCRYSPNEKIIAQKTGEYRCTGAQAAHSTKKCAVGVVKAIGVYNYIEIN